MSRIRECIDILDDWRNRALAAEKYAKEADAQINHLIAALAEANEDAKACAAFLEIVLDYTRDIGHPFNVAEINAAVANHRARCAKLEGGESAKDSPNKEAKG